MSMQYKNLSCRFEFAKTFSFSGFKADEYGEDTVLYALRRFFCNNPRVLKNFVTLSWKLRFAKGSERKPHFFILTAPASMFELPCGRVWVRLKVTASGVTVLAYTLFERKVNASDPVWWGEESDRILSEERIPA